MQDTTTIECIRQKYLALSPVMDEQIRRLWVATEASALGWGGVTAVSLATGVARNTIAAGLRELEDRRAHPEPSCIVADSSPWCRSQAPDRDRPGIATSFGGLGRSRRPEGIRSRHCAGPVRAPVSWPRNFGIRGTPVSDRGVAHLLKKAGYSLQANRKTREGSSQPDRNAQFEYINRQVITYQRRSQPVVSVNTKKMELVGEFKKPGVRNGNPKASRRRSKSMTSRTRSWVRRSLMGYTTSLITKAGSAWGSITIRRGYRGGQHRAVVAGDGLAVIFRELRN